MIHLHWWTRWNNARVVLQAARENRFYVNTEHIGRQAVIAQAEYLMASALYWTSRV